MSEPAVDLRMLQTPPTPDELAEFRAFVEPLRALAKSAVSNPLWGWQQMANHSLITLESALRQQGYSPTEHWLLELRKTAALALAKGYGEYDTALKLAPEIGAELAALRYAVERDDSEQCYCGSQFEAVTEFIWSPRVNAAVKLYQCAKCGLMNARAK